ncbi:MAG: aquaporin [Spirochaetia bacterium]
MIVMAMIYSVGNISSARMIPARSLGPALLSWNLEFLPLYLTAPILGTFLASPMCRIIQRDQCCGNKEGGKGQEIR